MSVGAAAAASSAPSAPRIGIVGAGVAGLALAAMLTRMLPSAKVRVFERGHTQRDEGYGLDLDEQGHKALQLAGAADRYWRIARPYSDVLRIFTASFTEPLLVFFRPRLIGSFMGPPAAETNRAAMRQLLLEAIAESGADAQVVHNCNVVDVRAVPSDTGTPMALALASDGSDVGTFDLLVDASGVHSILRRIRMQNGDLRPCFSGKVTAHGIITDPEATLPAELVSRLGQGSLFVVAKGRTFVLQRFGARPEDRRAALFYMTWRDQGVTGTVDTTDPKAMEALSTSGVAAVFEEVGLPLRSSRAAGTLARGSAELAALQAWIHADMGPHFHPLLHSAVDHMDQGTLRPLVDHAGKVELRPLDSVALGPPLVCIGDALRNIGLGGGGNQALQDARELAELLASDGAFDKATGHLALRNPGGLLEQLEQAMLKRHTAFCTGRDKTHINLRMRPTDPSAPIDIGFQDLALGFTPLAWLLRLVGAISKAWLAWDERHGGAGSAPPPGDPSLRR